MQDRWKTAPFVVETCNFAVRVAQGYTANWTEAKAEDIEYHVSAVGNGNQPEGYDGESAQNQADWLMTGKVSGYRYKLPLLKVSALSPGKGFTVTANWTNDGNAPIYEPWTIVYSLVNPSDSSVVWKGQSAYDLRSLLPTTTPDTTSDKYTLPTAVATGTYELHVSVKDPTGYYKNPIDPANPTAPRTPYLLKLAMQGRQNDGSYLLGNVTVK